MSHETKIGSVTIKALMLVEITHQSGWSPSDTFENVHRQAVRELENSIAQPSENLIRRMRIVKIEKIRSLMHEVDR